MKLEGTFPVQYGIGEVYSIPLIPFCRIIHLQDMEESEIYLLELEPEILRIIPITILKEVTYSKRYDLTYIPMEI